MSICLWFVDRNRLVVSFWRGRLFVEELYAWAVIDKTILQIENKLLFLTFLSGLSELVKLKLQVLDGNDALSCQLSINHVLKLLLPTLLSFFENLILQPFVSFILRDFLLPHYDFVHRTDWWSTAGIYNNVSQASLTVNFEVGAEFFPQLRALLILQWFIYLRLLWLVLEWTQWRLDLPNIFSYKTLTQVKLLRILGVPLQVNLLLSFLCFLYFTEWFQTHFVYVVLTECSWV